MNFYQKELKQLVGARILAADVEGDYPDAYPYLLVELPNGDRRYVVAQADAEGNGPGFLHMAIATAA
ncbi:hypothetical protein [Sphaerothrix gracilis]|uniref:hypothetical protein n=1 Tax=Sphaerothrix gracilis TaxID=3151835 RepID=UPI0031FD977F